MKFRAKVTPSGNAIDFTLYSLKYATHGFRDTYNLLGSISGNSFIFGLKVLPKISCFDTINPCSAQSMTLLFVT
jgi:hypothetical protein